jgi:hypothetical protein
MPEDMIRIAATPGRKARPINNPAPVVPPILFGWKVTIHQAM